jgi:hypothetical protein
MGQMKSISATKRLSATKTTSNRVVPMIHEKWTANVKRQSAKSRLAAILSYLDGLLDEHLKFQNLAFLFVCQLPNHIIKKGKKKCRQKQSHSDKWCIKIFGHFAHY